MTKRNKQYARKAGACRTLLRRTLEAARPRHDPGTIIAVAHGPQPTVTGDREQIDFECSCGYPLSALSQRGHVSIHRRIDHGGRREAKRLARCPNCDRDLTALVRLGRESFLDKLNPIWGAS